jgi:hypothetical protein
VFLPKSLFSLGIKMSFSHGAAASQLNPNHANMGGLHAARMTRISEWRKTTVLDHSGSNGSN